jgi:indolepyruvate decarboxylase
MPTTVKEYLTAKLYALGARHLFTVPGNYNAEFLLAANKTLQCIGTTNELEAGYAADAYTRLSRRPGVCCVTYGVGSFSLLNAFAGSHVEFCPVIMINGSAPAHKTQQLLDQGVLFAHAIDPLRTDERIFRQITDPDRQPGDRPLAVVISDPADAPKQIDDLLLASAFLRRPVYLEVPQDLWGRACADIGPHVSEDNDTAEPQADHNETAHVAAVDVAKLVRQAHHPVLWGGEMLQRFGLESLFQKLIDVLDIPYTTTLMAKGIVSETENSNRFIGVYDSKFAPRAVKQVVEGADRILALGTILSDFYGEIVARSYDQMILAAGNGVRIGRYTYPNVRLDVFLEHLLAELARSPHAGNDVAAPKTPPAGFSELVADRDMKATTSRNAAASIRSSDVRVTWDSFFERMRTWPTPSMTLLVDTSLALFPAAEIPLQQPGRFVAQTAWLSIGYTVAAAIGASMAAPDCRAVAFVGDGGFQMTAQAVSTLSRHKKAAVLFVFDNQLYGIEQYLVDMQVLPPAERFYPNTDTLPSFFDILPQWDYVKLAEALGGVGHAVSTHAELEVALAAAARETEKPTVVAVQLEPRDLPSEIRATFDVVSRTGALVDAVSSSGHVTNAAFN